MSAPKADENGVRWYGLHFNRRREDVSLCIEEVAGRESWPSYRQCTRKRGHGPDGLYCKQHQPDAVESRGREATKRYEEQRWRENRPARQRDAYRAALEDIAAGHNDPRERALEALKTE